MDPTPLQGRYLVTSVTRSVEALMMVKDNDGGGLLGHSSNYPITEFRVVALRWVQLIRLHVKSFVDRRFKMKHPYIMAHGTNMLVHRVRLGPMQKLIHEPDDPVQGRILDPHRENLEFYEVSDCPMIEGISATQ